ncbi:hypothetical protein D3C81_2008740 [compost metagenome]
MFHVEPGDVAQSLQCCRRFCCSDEYLRRCRQQAVQYPGLVGSIQLRGQIVERDDGPLATLLGVILRLRQQTGEGGELGLAA